MDFSGQEITDNSFSSNINSNADFTDATISGKIRNGMSFSEAIFIRTKFTKNFNIYRADFSNTDFTGADLYVDRTSPFDSTSIFGSSIFVKARFINANLERSNFSFSNLSGADFTGSYLKNINLAKTDLRGAVFTTLLLSSANLNGALLNDARINGADLRNTNLTDASIVGADLTDANLTGANLTNADLTNSIFTNSNLTNSNLSDADLTGAILTGANLTGANLTGAILTGANLTGANLTNSNLTRDDAIRRGAIFTDEQFNFGVHSTSIIRQSNNCPQRNLRDFSRIPQLDPIPWENITFTLVDSRAYRINFQQRNDVANNQFILTTPQILSPSVNISDIEERNEEIIDIDLTECILFRYIKNTNTRIFFGGSGNGGIVRLLNDITLPGRIIVVRTGQNLNNINGYFYINIDNKGTATTSWT